MSQTKKLPETESQRAFLEKYKQYLIYAIRASAYSFAFLAKTSSAGASFAP